MVDSLQGRPPCLFASPSSSWLESPSFPTRLQRRFRQRRYRPYHNAKSTEGLQHHCNYRVQSRLHGTISTRRPVRIKSVGPVDCNDDAGSWSHVHLWRHFNCCDGIQNLLHYQFRHLVHPRLDDGRRLFSRNRRCCVHARHVGLAFITMDWDNEQYLFRPRVLRLA
jgi:hypothetical protein